ncbi:hypothetical protein QWJ46_00795 [Rhizobium sp. CBN3]|uniref:hypothetical protein n=1 Tax=Rhizobium sp. CBN3 TaxID=3058045 RepID=UPI0026737F83|nr:hypothetical protein [Rhizobium sp. CBN3]MDO3431212.1 hypothetical protein [Rhizobium sp. CBN3]
MVSSTEEKAAAFDKIVAAHKRHVDAVSAYNQRLKVARAERECGDWSTKLDAEYSAMSDAQSGFIGTCQDLADLALSAPAMQATS